MYKHLLLLLLCFGFLPLSAQQVLIVDQAESQTLYYNYQNLSGASAMHLRNMFKEMLPQTHQQAGFQLNYLQEVKGYKSNNSNRLDFKVQLKNFQVSDLPLREGYAFTDEFTPERVRLTVEVRRSTGEVLTRQELRVEDIKDGTTRQVNFTYTDTLTAPGYQFYFVAADFVYTSDRVLTIRKKVQAISDAQASLQLLRNLEQRIKGLNTTYPQPDSLAAIKTELDACEQGHKAEMAKDFWAKLGLLSPNAYDPQGMAPLQKRLSDSLQIKRSEWTNWNNQPEVLYTRKAEDLYRINQVPQARIYLDKALKIKASYPWAQLLQAEMWLDADSALQAKDPIQQALNGPTQTPQLQQRALPLATRCQQLLGNHIQIALQHRQYERALSLTEAATQLCTQTQHYVCNQQANLEQARQQASFAWYEELVNRAQGLLQQSQTQFAAQSYVSAQSLADSALTLAEQGKTLRARYSAYILNDLNLPTLRASIVEQKYQSLFLAAEMDLKAGKAEQALAYALEGQKLSSLEPSLQTRKAQSEEQISRIQYQIYLNLVAQGDSLKTANQNQASIAAYEQAKKLDQQYGFTANGQGVAVDQKIQGSAREGIVRRAQMQLQGPDNQVLEALLDTLKQEALQYNLSADAEVSNALQGLQDRICHNARTALFPAQMQQVRHFRKLKDYPQALEAWKKAKALNDKYTLCQFDATELLSLQTEIEACARFQTQSKDLQQKEQTGQYRAAINLIGELNAQYQASEEMKTQLPAPKHLDLFAYLRSQPQPDYAYEGCLFALEQNQNDQAFELLKQALEAKISYKKTKYAQERLGIYKASQVFDRNKKSKDALKEVVGPNTKPWKYFSKTFKKKWKTM